MSEEYPVKMTHTTDFEDRPHILVRAAGRNRYLRDRGEIKTPEIIDELSAELAALRSENEKLKAALEPFVSELRYERDNDPELDACENDYEISITVLLGDLRNARDVRRACITESQLEEPQATPSSPPSENDA